MRSSVSFSCILSAFFICILIANISNAGELVCDRPGGRPEGSSKDGQRTTVQKRDTIKKSDKAGVSDEKTARKKHKESVKSNKAINYDSVEDRPGGNPEGPTGEGVGEVKRHSQ